MSLPVLYSFRRCPYAMRARLAIWVSTQPCVLREVVLRDKPPAMLDLSPKGTVPVLELPDGQVIEQSLEIMQWALAQNDPENWLAGDVEETAHLINQNDGPFKAALDRYKYETRYENVDAQVERQKCEIVLQDLEQRLKVNGFLCGPNPTLADYAILPFIRQFAHVDLDWFNATSYTHLQQWLTAFKDGALFKSIMKKYPQWHDGDKVTIFPR